MFTLQGLQQQVKECCAPSDEKVADAEFAEPRGAEDEALPLVDVTVVLVLGVGVGEGALRLQVVGEYLD